MDTWSYLFAGVMSACIGSFLNVVIYRVPRKMPLLLDRSRCPKCGTQLAWFHNIPIISFLLLLGRCGFCSHRISFRYPLVESLNTLLSLYFLWAFGPTLLALVYCILGALLIVIFFIDYDFQIIPDSITLPGIALGLIFSILPTGIGIVQSALGLLVGGGSLYAIAALGEWLFKKEAMGGGDIKMAAMLGAFLGWKKILLVFVGSASIGLAVSLIIMLFSARLRKERVIPFGPFLALAALVAVIYGDQLIEMYTFCYLTHR